MKTTRFAMLLVSLIAVQASLVARATEMAGPLQPNEIKWSPVPPVLPAGAQMAVLSGDPAGTGRDASPQDARRVSNTSALASDRRACDCDFGDVGAWHGRHARPQTFEDPASGRVRSRSCKHASLCVDKDGGIVEVNLIGPFAITYVNAGDDPSHKK